MTMEDTATVRSVRHKAFDFRTSLRKIARRSGDLISAGRTSLRISSPPEFRGEEGTWTPEHMLIGAVEGCLMVTFLSLAEHKNIHILAYESMANGRLEFMDGGYRFTRIVISPLVVAQHPAEEAQVLSALRDAEKRCLVSNSITAVVEVNPVVKIEDERPPCPATDFVED
jgi:organic hydroperoxide reductase OsmC/OhrA